MQNPPPVLFSELAIQQALRQIAEQLKDYYHAHTEQQDEEIIVLVLMNGGLWFAADLLRLLPSQFIMHHLHVSSYGEGHQSSGKLRWHSTLPPVNGKRVLLLDELIDTGLTLQEVSKGLLVAGASDVRAAVLVDKEPCRLCEFEAHFVGLKAGADYLIGYGLDDAGRYRNLPYIAKLN